MGALESILSALGLKKAVVLAGIEKHEHDHCDGRDHVGETYLRDLWEQHKRSNQPERKPT